MSLTPENLESLIKKHKHKGDLTTTLIDYLIKTSPDYTQGDIFYIDSDKTVQRLGAGTSGQFLKTLGADANPAWATVATKTDLDSLDDVTITSPVTGTVLSWNGSAWIDSQSPTLVEIITDTGGLQAIAFAGVTNGTRHIKFTNAVTSTGKALMQGAGDTNVPILIQGLGTGGVHLGDANLLFPDTDGSNGQLLQTDGSGTLSFTDVPSPITKSNAVQLYTGGSDFLVLTQDVNRLTKQGVVTIDAFESTNNTGVSGDGLYVGTAKADVTKDFAYSVILQGNTLGGTSGNVDFYTGISSSTSGPGPDGSFTDEHVGFLFTREDGNNSKVWASNAVSSTQTKTDVTSGITLQNFNVYRIERVSGSIYFYINGTLVATHTTNLPTDSTMNIAICRRGGSGGQFTLKNNWAYAQSL